MKGWDHSEIVDLEFIEMASMDPKEAGVQEAEGHEAGIQEADGQEERVRDEGSSRKQAKLSTKRTSEIFFWRRPHN